MSGESAHLIDNQEKFIKSEYDVVLILKSYETDPSMERITSQKFRKQFGLIFRLEEHTEKDLIFQSIQESLEAFLRKFPESAFTRDCYLLVTENIKLIIDEYLQLDAKSQFSVDQDEVHILLKASEENLMVQADIDEYLLQLKKQPEDNLDFQVVAPYGTFEKLNNSVYIDENNKFFKKYDFLDKEQEKGSLFKSRDKIRLIYSMLCNSMDMGLLQSLGIVINFMPLTNPVKLEILKNEWGRFGLLIRNPFTRANIHDINDYFGEKIGMYFAWLEFLMITIIPLAIISLVLGIISTISDDTTDTSSKFTPGEIVAILLAMILPFFSTIYEQLWIRRQNTLCWQWGTTDLSQVEEQRPEYEGKYAKDPVTGKNKKVPKQSHYIAVRRSIAVSVVGLFVALVLAAVVSLFLYRASLDPRSIGPTLVGIGNAIQIKIFNIIYGYVATRLNDWENYELPSQYSDNLTLKLFLFQFVNSYTSLFYIAFMKGTVEGCTDDNCIGELTLQLETIFITNLCLNIVEILTPMLLTKYKIWAENRAMRKKFKREVQLTEEEKQSKLSKYDTPLSDYMEVVIAYGYVILFGASFPYTSCLFLLLIIVEIRVDAWKLCTLTQRPFPEATNSIGVWIYIIQVMSIVGAITNVGIVVFTTDAFDIDDSGNKWLLFIILEHILLFFKITITLLVPDVPFLVQQALVWTKRIALERLSDKSESEKSKKAKNLKFMPIVKGMDQEFKDN